MIKEELDYNGLSVIIPTRPCIHVFKRLREQEKKGDKK